VHAVDALRYALAALTGQRLRSLLTVTGIAVGICAVVLVTSVGEGVRSFILGEFTQFGTRIIAVQPGRSTTFGVSGASIANVRPLSVDDAIALRRLPGVTAVVPVIQGNAEVAWGQRSRRTNVIGVGAEAPPLWRLAVASGSFLPADSYTGARAFVVLGSRMREELFGSRNPLGARVRIGADRFRVIGVMAPKGQMLGFDLDDTAFIPVLKAGALFNREGLMEIDLAYAEGTEGRELEARVRRLLVARHGEEDFSLITQDQMLSVLGDILDVLTAGIGAIGAISLVVGAVGIATIMTIAVSERTAEVGLLRALGAPRRVILRLFLGEAALLGAAGGIVGALVALVLVVAVRVLPVAVPLEIAWDYLALAFVSAIVIGLVAGLAPALRAAAMDPVEALRAE